MKKVVISLLILAASSMVSRAQEVRNVTVSARTPYREAVSVQCDEKGLVLNLMLTYDGDTGHLALSIAPDRPVIFFRESMKYSDIFSDRVLRTEKMSYPVQISPRSTYRLSRSVWKQYSGKRGNHIYNKWIGNVSSDMEELPPEVTEAGETAPLITTDSLYRCFAVPDGTSGVTFRLRNVVTADLVQKKKNGKSIYTLTGERDLNTTFNVTIERDACHGTGALRQTLAEKTEDISKGYARLHKACPGGVAASAEEVGVFNEHRQYLLSQFPPLPIESRCVEVQAACDLYNSYVDSIRTAPCVFVPQTDLQEAFYREQDRIHSATLVTAARTINEMTISLIMSLDRMEVNDICNSVRLILDRINSLIQERGVSGEDRDAALKLFREAEAFWQQTAIKYGH